MNLQTNDEQIPRKDYTESASLDFSMYVVLDRALPFVGDCLAADSTTRQRLKDAVRVRRDRSK